MRHHLKGRKLNRPTGPRMLMLRTMVTDFLRHEHIRTTDSKAREVQRMAEKIITQGKAKTLHSRRLTSAFLTDERIVRKVCDDLSTRFESRKGGYTRMIKIGPRKGDAAEMVVLELVE